MNNNTTNESVEEIDQKRVRSKTLYKLEVYCSGYWCNCTSYWGMSYYQATHFNSNVTINDTKVGGLSADQAIQKLKTSGLANKVYVDQQQILDEKDTKTELTEKDLPQVKKLLKVSGHFFLPQREKIIHCYQRRQISIVVKR